MPNEIVQEILRDPKAQNKWIQRWALDLDCSWAKHTAWESTVQQEISDDEWESDWLTFDMMVDHFKNEKVAMAYKQTLGSDPKTCRADTIAPDCAEAVRYHMPTAERTKKKSRRISEHGTKGKADVDAHAALKIAESLKPRRGASPATVVARPVVAPQASPAGTPTASQASSPRDVSEVDQVAKDIEEERKKAESAKESALKREAAKSDPFIQRRKWLASVSSVVDSCIESQAKADDCKKFPGTLAETYKNTFMSAEKNLKRTQTSLQKPLDRAALTKIMAKATSLKDGAALNVKAFKSLHSQYYPKQATTEDDDEYVDGLVGGSDGLDGEEFEGDE